MAKVDDILTGAGLVEGETYRELRFISPPSTTYAVYMDSLTRRGGDNINLLTEHNLTIELYEYAPDPTTEAAIEGMFDEIGQEYDKAERYWIEEEQLYQVIYTFSYLAKEV